MLFRVISWIAVQFFDSLDLRSPRDQMFIEPGTKNTQSSGRAEYLAIGILRSYGAQDLTAGNVDYKHSAALRPGYGD